MSELPRGTVTFLFTDIESSTRLLRERPDSYPRELAKHRANLRNAFRRHRGVEVDTQGDAFFVAFSRASDALAAAEDAQRVIAESQVRVRIGIHTGEPLVTDEGYVGLDVNRAARIAAAGHGGQILLSQSARDLAVQLFGIVPAQGPTWYVVLQAVVGLIQFFIALAMLAVYRKAGAWGAS